MFVKYSYINEVHRSALTSVIFQHAVVTEPLLAKLYLAALTLFQTGSCTPESAMITHYIKGASGTVAGATDERTGIYVQLSGPDEKLMLLTVGQKWAMQAAAKDLSQVATRHW